MVLQPRAIEPIRKRTQERRATRQVDGSGLDRRLKPLDTMEGQLQKAQRQLVLAHEYVEHKVEKLKEYYESKGKIFPKKKKDHIEI